MQVLLVLFGTSFLLALSGPAVGNVFSNVLEEFDTPPSDPETLPREAMEPPLCTVEVTTVDVALQAAPDFQSATVAVFQPNFLLMVFEVVTAEDGMVWYRAGVDVADDSVRGWVPADTVAALETSPVCPRP